VTAALLALLLSSSPAPAPRVVVSAYPRVSHVPAAIKPIGRVHDLGQQLHCPSFEWDFGDGSRSGWEPYCDPYERPEDRRTLWTLQPQRYHVYRVPGEYEIALRVVAGDRVLRASVRVIVAGTSLSGKETR
jgi:hypothetical protein